jgi:hypothetical protein
MSPQTEIAELRDRITRLERERESPAQRRTNQAGAARYLGISEETLRRRQLRGEGPRRTRSGRFWSYTYDDLDAYVESAAAAPS